MSFNIFFLGNPTEHLHKPNYAATAASYIFLRQSLHARLVLALAITYVTSIQQKHKIELIR